MVFIGGWPLWGSELEALTHTGRIPSPCGGKWTEFFEALSLESYCKKAIVRLFAATVTL